MSFREHTFLFTVARTHPRSHHRQAHVCVHIIHTLKISLSWFLKRFPSICYHLVFLSLGSNQFLFSYMLSLSLSLSSFLLSTILLDMSIPSGLAVYGCLQPRDTHLGVFLYYKCCFKVWPWQFSDLPLTVEFSWCHTFFLSNKWHRVSSFSEFHWKGGKAHRENGCHCEVLSLGLRLITNCYTPVGQSLGFQSIFLWQIWKGTMICSGCGTQTSFLYHSASRSVFSIQFAIFCLDFMWIFMTLNPIILF